MTVSPVLVASVVPPDHKDLRLRGTLAGVDVTNKTYTVQVQPFHEKSNKSQSPVVVQVTDATAFEVNGTVYNAADGLAQLAALPADTLTIAYGSLSATGQSFTATKVLAGNECRGRRTRSSVRQCHRAQRQHADLACG